MAKADDYRICCALFSAYIAKVSKRNPRCMTDDRREITDAEILTLIDWKLEQFIANNEGSNGFVFEGSDGKKIELHYYDEEETKPTTE